jgi:hypothetical protein
MLCLIGMNGTALFTTWGSPFIVILELDLAQETHNKHDPTTNTQWQPLVSFAKSSRVPITNIKAIQYPQLTKFTGEIPSMKLFESEKTLAFLDIQPLSRGHSVILPLRPPPPPPST